MVDFKVVLSDPKTGRSFKMTASGGAAGAFIGQRVGGDLDATPLGLPGYRVKITGASDRNGTPARRELPGAGRRRLLLAGGVGFRPVCDGQRARKAVRGSEITQDFVQINAKVTQYGEKQLDELLAPPATE
ncbi:MAG: 30S ribosomal protein S6e [Methanospirillum sp.]|nr:30S ribosomal protein S6e [Methanospirillum sp.]